jgi:plastocyanin domain-containing protein
MRKGVMKKQRLRRQRVRRRKGWAIALLLLSVGVGTLGVQVTPLSAHSMPSPSTQSFQKIDQPLPLKATITLVGLGLLGLELWWFLGNHQRLKP